jgi:hypothetical protein
MSRSRLMPGKMTMPVFMEGYLPELSARYQWRADLAARPRNLKDGTSL